MWLSEALWAPLLFPEKAASAERLAQKEAAREKIRPFSPPKISDLLDETCAGWCEDIDWSAFDLIGFSLCFHQTLASLYLARRIKARYPENRIVFGGSSILAGMAGTLQRLAGVDFCISGEGELPLLGLCRRILSEKSDAKRLFSDKTPEAPAPPDAMPCDRRQLADLDGLPMPDYGDYFRDAGVAFGPSSPPVTLPVEFSRGCWWNKCAFCNLNLQWSGYRRKSANRMKKEISTLISRHQVLDFSFTDNCLPLRESRQFFSLPAAEGKDINFFAEVRQEQAASFESFRLGGLSEVQVGIEALSSGLLARMGKGGKTIDNIYAMKHALECGIQLQGNLILCFPGSTELERDETLRNLEFVFPYTPLQGASFFLGHSSPVHRAPKVYGIRAITVHPKFRALLPDCLLGHLPLLVCGYRGDRLEQNHLWQPVRKKIEAWQRFHRNRGCSAVERPLLEYRDGGDFLLIRQEYPDERILHHRLNGTSRTLYLFCSAPVSCKEICLQYPSLDQKKIADFLHQLQRKRLVFEEDGRYLALAVRQRQR